MRSDCRHWASSITLTPWKVSLLTETTWASYDTRLLSILVQVNMRKYRINLVHSLGFPLPRTEELGLSTATSPNRATVVRSASTVNLPSTMPGVGLQHRVYGQGCVWGFSSFSSGFVLPLAENSAARKDIRGLSMHLCLAHSLGPGLERLEWIGLGLSMK